MNLQREHFLEKGFWFCLYCLAILFPFSALGGKIFIIAAALIWIAQGKYKHIKNEYFPWLIIFSAYYFMNFVGLLHSDNMPSALTRLESRLNYLLFPLLLFTSSYNEKNYNTIFYCFSISVTCITLVSVAIAIVNITPHSLTDNFDQLSYIHLTDPLSLHPTYLGICVSIALLFILTKVRLAKLSVRILLIATVMWLTIYLFLLLSRGTIIAFITAIVISGLTIILRKRSKKFILLLTASLVLMLISFFSIDILRNRFLQPLKNSEALLSSDNQFESVALHVKSWFCAKELLSDEHFFTGYGSGDEKDVLARCYGSHGWNIMVEERFNAHNEYLSCLLRNGIIECLTLIIFFGAAFYWSFKTKNTLYLAFTIIFFISLLFTTLNDFSAMVALTFFNALLFVKSRNQILTDSALTETPPKTFR